MRSILHSALCVLVTLALTLFSLRYLHDHWLFSTLYSLQLHATLGLAAGAVIAILLRRNLYGVFLLVWASALVLHALFMLTQFRVSPSPEALAAPHFRLLSFNIRGGNTENGERIAAYVMASGADVAVILEARPIQPFLAFVSQVYPYHIGCENTDEECDLLLLSRHPFGDTMRASLSDLRKNRFALADIRFNGRKVHVAAAHLSKPYYDRYHYLELYNLSQIVEANEGPLILAGDFNAEILAPDMRAFLRYTGLRTAPAEPRTWPVRARRFGIAIDHVFARAPLELIETRRIPDAFGSNHYGLVSEFAIPASAGP